MSSIVGCSSGNSVYTFALNVVDHTARRGDRCGASGRWKTWYLINLICFPRVNICNYIHLLLVILPTRCEFGMMEHRHLLHKHISQICEAQLDLILFYSHSMNQPKYICCCLCGKGFKTNMKMGLNQITLLLTTRKFSSGHPSPLPSAHT